MASMIPCFECLSEDGKIDYGDFESTSYPCCNCGSRKYKEIFESHFSEEALKLLSNKEEFGKWLERGRWIAKKCDEINRELEQYRAIGTVEELKSMKENGAFTGVELAQLAAMQMRLKEYSAIGTIEEFKALKEKNTAKNPTPIDYEKYIGVIENAKFLRGAYWCPNCKHTVRSGAYCDDCGQKLDWQ